MALSKEQLDYIKKADALGPDSNGHKVSALEVMAAGQFEGVDFDSVEEIEEALRELDGESGDQPAALPNDSFWAIPGLLLAGPYPGSLDEAEARAALTALLDTGVTTFIDLTEESETGPQGEPLLPYAQLLREVAAEQGVAVNYMRFEILDVNVPPPWKMEAIIAAIEIATANGETVYVHCAGGIGRTGTVLGCYAISRGDDPSEVLGELAQLRRHTTRANRPAPETGEQRSFVTNWRAKAGS